jgi:hypothetical protein
MTTKTETNAVIPKEGLKTSSFKVVLLNSAPPIILSVITGLVQLGVIEADSAGALNEGLNQLLFLFASFAGFAYVSGKYIEGRSKVSEEKARAATEVETFKETLGQA